MEEDPMAYYPEVKTVSAVIQNDGSVVVTGEITSNGTTPISYAGFCMDSTGSPEMLDAQELSDDVSSTTFTANYSGFDPYQTYYFRTFATNEFGYAYGNIISLDSIQAPSVTPICTLTANTVNIGGGTPTGTFSSIGAPSQSFDTWEIYASSSNTSMTFYFESKPQTGEYITTFSNPPFIGGVKVSFYQGFLSGTLSSGSTVYINQTGPNTWEITICDAPWAYNSSTFYLNSAFTCPL